MVRVGNRVFLLGVSSIVPVDVLFGTGGSVGFGAEDAVALEPEGPELIATGAGRIYVAFRSGRVQVWTGTASPDLIDDAELGARIAGWVVRGRRIFAALRGVGLRVVDMTTAGQLEVLFSAPEFDDLEGLERHGNLVVVSLARGLLMALDLSDIAAPRALVSRQGALPQWIASVGGNLLLGSDTQLSVFGVPPFVSASVPPISRAAFPRYGSIPLQLSRAIDPETVTIDSVRLLCGGQPVAGRVVVSLDNLRITFLPESTLPAGATCTLDLDGVTDTLGMDLSSVQSALGFTTVMAAPEPIENPHSAYEHTADGEFTDWEEGADEFEYFDVTAAQGMYSHFYADYDGERLWLLNDWFYNGDDIDPDCYNQFGVWTGGGTQRWDIRAFGDQRIEVRLNGELLASDDARVTGGYGHVGSPNDPDPHTVYEISIATEPGAWGVQLHDPGPTFSCHQLETDPTNYNGASMTDTTMIDPTQAPTMPPLPVITSQRIDTATPTLLWGAQDNAPSQFTAYVIEVSTGDDLGNVFYRIVVYGQQLVVPAGLLQPGMTYTFRVTAYNLAGSVSSEPVTFTVPDDKGADVEAPVLGSVDPSSVVQGDGATLTINGTGFVEGARAYFGDLELATTFVSSQQITAMLPDTATGTAGSYNLSVRNVPDDGTTQSQSLPVTVTEPGSTTVTLTSLDPNTITTGSTTVVTVNLTNAPSSEYFALVLTPAAGGGALTPIFCDWIGSNQCQASVNAAAAVYDAHVVVGEGQGAYNTNTLDNALTVNAAAATVTLVSPLAPNSATASTATVVDVTLTNGVSGLYYLVLTPTGGGSASSFFCDWTAMNNCEATVTLATAGTYDAKIQVGEGVGQYDTNTLSSAFTVNAGGLACFMTGNPAAPSGSGSCGDPYVLDLSASQIGTTLTHSGPAGSDHTFGTAGSSCSWSSFNRIVYQVLLPAGATGYQVSVDPLSDANPQIAILGDASCMTASLCVDDGAATACEVAQAIQTTHFTGTSPYFVVNRAFSQAITVRVRANQPAQ
jgi:hypothetical protein